MHVLCHLLYVLLQLHCNPQRGGDPAEAFGLLTPEAPLDVSGGSSSSGEEGCCVTDTTAQAAAVTAEDGENEVPDSPPRTRAAAAAPLAAELPAAAGKRSRIPTLGARAGLADRTNMG